MHDCEMSKRKKYILALMEEVTLKEAWHARVSLSTFFVGSTLLFLLALGLLSCAILFTPLRGWLPGNTDSMRHELVDTSTRLDSLATSLEVERRYLDVLKQVMAGEVSSDTVNTLDSMQLVMREELLEAKSQALEDFQTQYEEKERDNMLLFSVRETSPVQTLFTPAHGVVVHPYSAEEKHYCVELRTPERENVTAVLAGTVVSVNYEIDNTYTMVLQHGEYVSIYRQVGRVLKNSGSDVRAGESIAIADAEKLLCFELWKNGKSINPEEVIVF